FEIKKATVSDVPLILSFIKELAEYEKLPHEVVATEEILQESLFGTASNAEVILGYLDNKPVAFAIFFYNFSSFLGKRGIYLEDLYVKENLRGNGLGQKMLQHVAKIAVDKNCGRLEWSVLDWNTPAINFYQRMGAKAMDEWTVNRVTGPALNQLANEPNDI
ncbi:MAG TPA: GNAT family N-acetyltransferase, partial [Gammaproteobacteria bacterium]|nr:GNAT family N-acetyltransferase [Gammaproteobacteria bacterium]